MTLPVRGGSVKTDRSCHAMQAFRSTQGQIIDALRGMKTGMSDCGRSMRDTLRLLIRRSAGSSPHTAWNHRVNMDFERDIFLSLRWCLLTIYALIGCVGDVRSKVIPGKIVAGSWKDGQGPNDGPEKRLVVA